MSHRARGRLLAFKAVVSLNFAASSVRGLPCLSTAEKPPDRQQAARNSQVDGGIGRGDHEKTVRPLLALNQEVLAASTWHGQAQRGGLGYRVHSLMLRLLVVDAKGVQELQQRLPAPLHRAAAAHRT